ncbi:hypothetical protein CI109_102591 [Kwoniella shandongensis]|uniref:Uncharacterized protein n=1 Tax=Kwoniella shandongensis TaxID=1734106 RepID=A0A5M6BUI7_9TREE|nr:uncharacterized protein CI109_005172 [Kwoniella shandongensis]KAA5526403.1 hypothetical protein CI109_005172 [Kwoniella shandongensis]
MSLGASPTAPSLLIPPNPAFSAPDVHPRGGILINVHRGSEPSHHSFPVESSSSSSFGNASTRRISEPNSPVTPISATFGAGAGAGGEAQQNVGTTSPFPSPGLGMSPKPPKIRFAPLPDPRRPRSLSTGRNIAWTTTIGEDGQEGRQYEIKGMDRDDDSALLDSEGIGPDDENDMAVEDEEDDEDGDEDGESGGHKRGRSWSKTMGSSWKGTKKLLSGKNPVTKEKEEESSYGTNGAPLKKSVSTGGFIGSSPFRWTVETERRKSMQGPPPASVSSMLSARRPEPTASSSLSSLAPTSPGHRRNSSLEPTTTSSALGSSPTPVKMLNGRVYGSRRASEAAEREKVRLQRMEPAFVEWGSAGVGASLESSGSRGADPTVRKSGGFLGDEDDGGGMAWVKRRREERKKKEQEEREKKLLEERQLSEAESATEISPTDGGAGLSSSHSSTSSLDLSRGGDGTKPDLEINTTLKTPAIATSELPPTPIIHVSESSPVVSTRMTMSSDDVSSAKGVPVGSVMRRDQPSDELPPTPVSAVSAKVVEENDTGHVVQAMRIPSDATRKGPQTISRGPGGAGGIGRDIFGDEDVSPTRRQTSVSDDEDDDEDEDDEDDGDFEDDEEEEEDAVRTTSSAAGVEVISRHKN